MDSGMDAGFWGRWMRSHGEGEPRRRVFRLPDRARASSRTVAVHRLGVGWVTSDIDHIRQVEGPVEQDPLQLRGVSGVDAKALFP